MVRTNDKRHQARQAGEPEAGPPAGGEQESSARVHLPGEGDPGEVQEAAAAEGHEVLTGEVVPEPTSYLEDLRRVQAEFDNYRKRMLREQTAMAQRASARLIEGLLPILDNFERALAHGEGGPGVEMTVKELRKVLADEGLEEIESEGELFDPHVHEAFEVLEDDGVSEPRVGKVLRQGYRLKGHVLRPAMVRVIRPPETSESDEVQDGTSR